MNHFQQQLPPIKISLISAKFIEVPATCPIHFKPLSLNASPILINELQNVTHGGLNIDPVSLRKIAREIVKPSEVSQGIVGIVGGWAATRCAVFLHFQIETNGKVYSEIYNGYTDFNGVSAAGNVAGDMRIFINSHMRVAEYQRRGPTGLITAQTAGENTQVLRPIVIEQFGNTVHGDYGLRPTDILTGWQKAVRGDDGAGFDHRGNLAAANCNLGVASRRRNNISSNHLSKMLANYSTAINETDAQYSSNQSWIAGTASAASAEIDYSSFSVFNMLKESTSYSETASFSMNELLRAPIAIDMDQVKGIPIPRGLINVMPENNGWGDYSLETQLAQQLAHAVPAVCTQYTRAGYAFTAYGDASGVHSAATQVSTPLFDSPTDHVFSKTIENVLASGILPEVFDERVNYYTLSAVYTVGGTVDMNISIDGGPEVPYSLPNYCDALSTTNITTNKDDILNGGRVFDDIVQGTFTGNNPGLATQY